MTTASVPRWKIDSINRRVHLFDTTRHDFDNSVAHGAPDDGTLSFGVHLPDVQNFSSPWAESGYYHFFGADTNPRHTDDWGTLALISTIEKTGRFWRDPRCLTLNRTRRIGILDLSRQSGGVFYNQAEPSKRDHLSHQNGLDVDVRYMRSDGGEAGLDFADPNSRVWYDSAATRVLMQCFRSQGAVVRIFVDTDYVKIVFPGVTLHDPTHRNHFHVRIRDPDGAND